MPSDIISACSHLCFDLKGNENIEMQYLSVLLRDGRLIFINFIAMIFNENEIGEILF